ncbi:putative pectinesterase 63 [Acorus calamus]|uniref:Pectinesterase n=1 Tax=Acorus calamus TaxID=4465 RepID=A0AAV9E7D5_ACOCL|nr:putative pectinesterase 63 [Acorus calamus]
MARKPSPPPFILFATLLLLLLPLTSADFDHWVSTTVEDYHQRLAEIANGTGTGLDLRLAHAESQRRVITVRQDGTGDFSTVTEAVASIPSPNSRRTVLVIGPGVYREKVVVDRTKPYVTFYGDPLNMPTITFNGTAAEYGTVQSATVAVDSHYFIASNVIFENSAPMPDGRPGSQAVAFTISGDKAALYNCKFYGFQDTLCDDRGKHFFKDCLIRGTVDFIFGNGRSLYQDCVLESVSKGIGYLTAQARTTKAEKTGFSFVNCTVTGTGQTYLSRAWMQSSRVVFAYTYMGSVVDPIGWDDKGFTDRQRTVYYGEYKCMGPGANTSKRARYGRVLTDEQAKPFLSLTFIRASTWLLPPPSLPF